ncbi:MAG: hypothetical protein ACRDZT_04405, partial [Acidimicrobiales bacterium]
MPEEQREPAAPLHKRARAGYRRWHDVVGVTSVVVMAGAFLSPVLKDGWSFGPFDQGSFETIGHHSAMAAHNVLNGDIINQGVQWNALDWRTFHAGHIPLWNSFSALGIPQAFNFESGAFSLPDLFSYAVPLRYAFLVVVFVKLLIAGTGAYVLCRQLGTRPVSAAFGGVCFMLSGAFANWLGWSLSGVVCPVGWVCALMLLCYRDPRRRWPALLAVAIAFSFFGGFPEMYLLEAGALAAFAVAGLVALLALGRRPMFTGSLRALIGLVAGTVLAAPLLLPGRQVIALSPHALGPGQDVNPPMTDLATALAQGYYGLPIAGSHTFHHVNYYETVSYVGVVLLALCIVGIVAGRRQAAVIAMAGLGFVSLASSYRFGSFDPAGRLLTGLNLGAVHSPRLRLVGWFAVAILGAVGLDHVLERPGRTVRVAFAATSLL